MKNITIIIVALILILGFLYYTGSLDNLNVFSKDDVEQKLPQGAQPLYLSNFDIFQVFQGATDKDLNYQEFLPYIDTLHMKMWGVSGTDALSVVNSYSVKYVAEGYNSLGRQYRAAPNWVIYMEGWHLNQNAKAVVVGEGAVVMSAFEHDVVILTMYGPLNTFYQFAAIL